MTKILVFIAAIILTAGCDPDWKVYMRDYSFVADHLNAQGCNGCAIRKLVSFQHAEHGFTGGLYIYKFAVTDADGGKWDVTYMSYKDLGPDTVSNIKKKPHSGD